MFVRAKVFKSLGYPTAILKDSDKYEEHIELSDQAHKLGIPIFEWGHGYSTEDALFNYCPAEIIPDLLKLAVERKGSDSINANLQFFSNNNFSLDDTLSRFEDNMRPVLADAAKSKKGAWYKDIEPAENIARFIVGPQFNNFHLNFQEPLNKIYSWVKASSK
jgi:hypothetical protein